MGKADTRTEHMEKFLVCPAPHNPVNQLRHTYILVLLFQLPQCHSTTAWMLMLPRHDIITSVHHHVDPSGMHRKVASQERDRYRGSVAWNVFKSVLYSYIPMTYFLTRS